MRRKKCKACREHFEPSRPLQAVCSPLCGIAWTRVLEERKREKQERAEHRERREQLKTLPKWLHEAQLAFNAWIRWRDRHLPCVSCGRYHDGRWNAGHYRTVAAAPELRFDERNCHRQCAPCNNHKSGDIVNYRINLISRIGPEGVSYLEGPHEPKRYRIEDARAIRDKYRQRLRDDQRRVKQWEAETTSERVEV